MCLFCKIANKEIASSIIYEDDQCMAFLDISQVCLGHTLIIPKKHYDNFMECDNKILSHIQLVAKDLSKHLIATLHATGLNTLTNTSKVAGQSVFHYHMHLIPRYSPDDAFKIAFNPSPEIDLDKLLQQLKK